MKIIFGVLLLFSTIAFGQQRWTICIIDLDNHQPVAGASLVLKAQTGKGVYSDSSGRARLTISEGSHALIITCTGYLKKEIILDRPQQDSDCLIIGMEPVVTELEDLIVHSTRIPGHIKNLPVRVEVLGTEDMEEETSMHPSNVAMLLSEASGIQTQQTSASSGNVQIRILGLDGKYTQLLKDGFPMYSGFSNGLSIMQIPPLDLRQVELIKGSSSSLYGGDAIAGIINFISKKPAAHPSWNILANQTSRSGTDAGSFYAVRNRRMGLTLLTTFNHQVPADIHNSGFTVLPKLTAFTVNPKLFWYPSDSATLSLSLNATYDDRAGGDLQAVRNGKTIAHPYLETSRSNRDFYQLEYEQHLPRQSVLTVHHSLSGFSRDIGMADYYFSGRQTSSFSEISYLQPLRRHSFVTGLNLITDQFHEKPTDSLVRNYGFSTIGIFAQDDWNWTEHLVWEIGLRSDFQNMYGVFLLPRVSVLYKASSQWSFRFGGGLGYKSPTIFDARTEETAYRHLLPIGSQVQAEKSASVNADCSYSSLLGNDMHLTLNTSFFYTRISNPLNLDSFQQAGSSYFYFQNAAFPGSTRGAELSIRIRKDDWNLFAGYTYIDARTGAPDLPHIPLTPRDKLVFEMSKEKDNDYRIALEAFYTGRQYRSDGSGTPDFWVTGLLLEKPLHRLTLILNFEDLTDTRQTRFGPVVIPPITNPAFQEIYAPMEGFMANLAVKLRIL